VREKVKNQEAEAYLVIFDQKKTGCLLTEHPVFLWPIGLL